MSSSTSRPDQLLLEALRRVRLPLPPPAQASLQAHVCAFVDERRNEGWSVERVIIALKQLAEEAGLFRGDFKGTAQSTPRDAERFLATLVTWCIDHYYRPLPEDG